ncbi:biotin--[acetyl-CoA-carboxylase] ligase [Stomatohabitans albus]|uniref:biotin--[acetyl-CoA-carboxylase] ligase n=1 Tax=Stomatohabitans albus TaxID=3110766 RepID=UPI00300D6090
MRFTIDELSAAAHSCQWVTDVIALEETDSTNLVGLRAAQDGAPHFTVIIAAHQTQGRGRHDRVWESPAGSSLTVSVVLRPNLVPEDWGHIPLLTGLGVSDGLREYAATMDGVDPDMIGLKWPNDVLIAEKKVCGVLLEADIRSAHLDAKNAVVAGFGINVDWRGVTRPDAFAERATSLAEWAGCDIETPKVLTMVLNALSRQWSEVGNDPAASIARVRERLRTIGRSVSALGDRPVQGTAIGITPQGHLVIMPDTVNSNDNTPVIVRAADVEHLR